MQLSHTAKSPATPITFTAAEYADLGLSPIRIARREKKPIGNGWQKAPIDAAGVDRWIAQGGNVGLRMGDGLIALDADAPGAIERAEAELGPLPGTLTSRTGSGNEHRIFCWPEDLPMPGNGVRWRADLDVRSTGGQIVVAPSIHPNGNAYEWTNFDAPADLPRAWCDAMLAGRSAAPGKAQQPVEAPTGEAAALVERHAKRIAAVAEIVAPHYEEGGRHALTRALAAWLAGLDDAEPWSDPEIVAVIDRLPTDQPVARKRTALEAAAQRRRGEITAGWGALSSRVGPEDEARLEEAAQSESERWLRGTPMPERKAKAANTNADPGGAEYAPPANEGDQGDDTGDTYKAVNKTIERLAEMNVYQRSGSLITVTREAVTQLGVVRAAGAPTIRSMVHVRLAEIITVMFIEPALAEARAEYESDIAEAEIALASCAADDAKAIATATKALDSIKASMAAREQKAHERAAKRGNHHALVILARGQWAHIRPLDAIVSYPVMRRDGSILATSGYDDDTRTLAEIPAGLRLSVPDAPTLDDARAAIATLTELVRDFPFATSAGRSAWLAMLLTVVARPAIDGPTPLGLIDATHRGSGKGLLVDVISLITTGERATVRAAPKSREEWDKTMLTLLSAGDPLVALDNIVGMLVSDALDMVLTATTYGQRVLGATEDRRVAVRTVFVATANNIRLSTDLVRRSLQCRLEPACEDPAQRPASDFAHGDLRAHVRRERAKYLSAALTIVRAYSLAGRPRVEARPMGSYEEWCRVVRDALVWAGAADPVVTQDSLRESADVERDELRDLLAAWFTRLGDKVVTARDLVDASQHGKHSEALADALQGITPNGQKTTTHVIGNRLRTLRGNMVDGLALREGPRARGDRATFQVVRL